MATAVCVSVCLSVCVSDCLFLAAFRHYCADSDVTWGNRRECPLIVHYWADLQSVCSVVPLAIYIFLIGRLADDEKFDLAHHRQFNVHCRRPFFGTPF